MADSRVRASWMLRLRAQVRRVPRMVDLSTFAEQRVIVTGYDIVPRPERPAQPITALAEGSTTQRWTTSTRPRGLMTSGKRVRRKLGLATRGSMVPKPVDDVLRFGFRVLNQAKALRDQVLLDLVERPALNKPVVAYVDHDDVTAGGGRTLFAPWGDLLVRAPMGHESTVGRRGHQSQDSGTGAARG